MSVYQRLERSLATPHEFGEGMDMWRRASENPKRPRQHVEPVVVSEGQKDDPKSLVAAGITGPGVVWRISCFHCIHSLSFVLSPPNQDSTGGKPESSVLSALPYSCEMRCTTNVSEVFLRQLIPLLIDRSC